MLLRLNDGCLEPVDGDIVLYTVHSNFEKFFPASDDFEGTLIRSIEWWSYSIDTNEYVCTSSQLRVDIG